MITAQVESVSAVLEEVKPLLPRHHEEVGLFRDKMPLNPDYQRYLNAEANGSAFVTTLREAGRLVGYFVAFVEPGLHYQSTLTCKMDLIYVEPEHRGLQGGLLLLEETKRELKRRGVKMWWVGSKNHKPIEFLFKMFGFDPAETYFAMWLGGDDA